jgi:sulfate transport system substrate-binding protein
MTSEDRTVNPGRPFSRRIFSLAAAALLAVISLAGLAQPAPVTLLNVSYDPTRELYGNVPTLDSGARDSTTSFARRAQGDVLIAWENEADLHNKEFGAKFDIVAPSLSILAETAVAVVGKNVDKKGTRAVWEKAKTKYTAQFAKINLFTIDEAFGGWPKADKEHFAEGASFDQI